MSDALKWRRASLRAKRSGGDESGAKAPRTRGFAAPGLTNVSLLAGYIHTSKFCGNFSVMNIFARVQDVTNVMLKACFHARKK